MTKVGEGRKSHVRESSEGEGMMGKGRESSDGSGEGLGKQRSSVAVSRPWRGANW